MAKDIRENDVVKLRDGAMALVVKRPPTEFPIKEEDPAPTKPYMLRVFKQYRAADDADGLCEVTEDQLDALTYEESRAQDQDIIAKLLKPRAAEYVESCKARLRVVHERMLKTNKLKKSKPLRKPRGKVSEKHDERHYWLDAIWCGDITMDWAEEFYHKELADFIGEYFNWGVYSESQVYVNELFDEAFRAVMPKYLHEVLEG